MKLTKAQAHIANEILSAHQGVTTAGEMLRRNANSATLHFANQGRDEGDMVALAGMVTHLAGVVAARDLLWSTAAAVGLPDRVVDEILIGPRRFYMEGQEI